MKKTTLTILSLFIALFALQAQVTGGDTTHHSTYLFATFKPGFVKMKSGAVEKADLNYDGYSQQVAFMKGTEVMQLTGLEEVDTIYFSGRKFIPIKKNVYEIIETGDPVTLLVIYDAKIKPLTSTVGHDGYSKKSANEVTNTITSGNLNRSRYQSDYNIELHRTYFFLRYSDIYKSNTEKQVVKAFPENVSEKIRTYFDTNKVDLKDADQLLALMRHANEKKVKERKK
ncbi:MAG: hypothetical protein EOO09_12645 [Chitinophagaceae bacterium]|nr:MAG: hypothetical protein EOO09_12645 [Chitinophagaceae bacterium]